MLVISERISIPDDEIVIHAIRARGAGGQHVNKVSSAIHLRFDIGASSLPDELKERLLQLRDRRISNDGIIIIKARQFRSQQENRADALMRLQELIRAAIAIPKQRRATRRSRTSIKRRLETKSRRSHIKSLRRRVIE